MCLFGLFTASWPAGVLHAQSGRLEVVYISPLPASAFNRPGTNIILRTKAKVSSGEAARFITGLTGTGSGAHEFTVGVSDDGRTVICRPLTPFLQGEQVTVGVDTDLVNDPASPGILVSWRFTTGSPAPYIPDVGESMMGSGIPASAARHVASSSPRTAVTDSLPGVHVLFSSDPSPGYIYLSNLYWDVETTPYLLVLGNDGRAVMTRKTGINCYDFKLQPNGSLTYYYGDDGYGFFQEADRAFTVVDSFKCGNGYATDPHELILLPNGHALLMGSDPEFIDMSKLVPGGYNPAEVVGLIIQELDQEKNVVFQWRSWDHFNITDAWHLSFASSYIDYVHGNSLDVDTDGNIILSSRHLNEITKIDRETGNIIWRLGGTNNQFTFVNDPLGFSYQHDVRRIANGHLTVFDNGDFHVPAFSRALEYALDETNMTATLVWQYRDTPDVFGFAMGNVQRLKNGNTFIGWGATNPTVTEVDSGGNKVYEMSLDEGLYSYRAYRSDEEAQVTGVERNVVPPAFGLAQNYPNPFNPTTTIQYSIPSEARVTLDVVDILGREVARLVNREEPAGTYSEKFDGTNMASGVYFYRLQAGEFVSTKKLLLVH